MSNWRDRKSYGGCIKWHSEKIRPAPRKILPASAALTKLPLNYKNPEVLRAISLPNAARLSPAASAAPAPSISVSDPRNKARAPDGPDDFTRPTTIPQSRKRAPYKEAQMKIYSPRRCGKSRRPWRRCQRRSSPGYGRNYLLPQGLAKHDSLPGNLKVFEKRTQEAPGQDGCLARERAACRPVWKPWKSLFPCACGRKTTSFYGSVTYSTIIGEAISALGIDVDRRRILMDAPIRTLGEHPVRIRLHADVIAVVPVKGCFRPCANSGRPVEEEIEKWKKSWTRLLPGSSRYRLNRPLNTILHIRHSPIRS